MEEIERIKKLSDAFGPSGFEEEVAAVIRQELPEYPDLVHDHMQNLRCQTEPNSHKPKVMLDSHMDEVGLIVQAIKPNGTMRFLTLGGWSPVSLPSSAFHIRNQSGQLVSACVACKPPHFASKAEQNQLPQVADMVLDCGSPDAAATQQKFGIHVGSPAAPDVTCRYQEEKHLFYGKAFDCRIGVAAEIETMKRLRNQTLPVNVQASFSVQEEVGERGVYSNYKALQPDVMICFEGCPADDTFTEPYMTQAALYHGPMLRHMDVSMITNPRFQKLALETAHRHAIPVQESVRSGGGTNGARINQDNVPAIVIGVPVRYIHSSNCFCTLDDYRAAVDLAVCLCQELTADIIAEL